METTVATPRDSPCALVTRRRGYRQLLLHHNIDPRGIDLRTLPGSVPGVKSAALHNAWLRFAPIIVRTANDRSLAGDGNHANGGSDSNLAPVPHAFTDPALASLQEISAFLAEVERRAFKHAMYALRDEDSALDVVQEAMLKLTEKYAHKPAAELPLLFQRILQNAIHDHFRRQKVRSTWTTLLSALGRGEDRDDEFDPLETLPAKSESSATADPAEQLEQAQVMAIIERSLARLPARQREAFLLRYWEELDVAETAAAMGCSEGSVKTHCSRAVHALAELLQAHGVTL